MSLEPLLNAAPAIQIHAFTAMAAFALGAVQLAAPKGTLPHRTMGWIWVLMMVVVATTSFWIHELRMWGPWSPIHLLALYTLAVRRARPASPREQAPQCHDRTVHRRARHRWPVYLRPRPHHARRGVRKLNGRHSVTEIRGFAGAAAAA